MPSRRRCSSIGFRWQRERNRRDFWTRKEGDNASPPGAWNAFHRARFSERKVEKRRRRRRRDRAHVSTMGPLYIYSRGRVDGQDRRRCSFILPKGVGESHHRLAATSSLPLSSVTHSPQRLKNFLEIKQASADGRQEGTSLTRLRRSAFREHLDCLDQVAH